MPRCEQNVRGGADLAEARWFVLVICVWKPMFLKYYTLYTLIWAV